MWQKKGKVEKLWIWFMVQTSVQMTVSNSLRSHGLQHARPPCPSPTPGVTQTHVHQVSDAIQPSHPLSPSLPAFNLSQHQDLFKWVSSSHQVAKVLEFQLQHQFSGPKPLSLSRLVSATSAYSHHSKSFLRDWQDEHSFSGEADEDYTRKWCFMLVAF